MPELPDQPLIAHLEALRNALLNMLYMTAALYPAAYWITPEVIDFLVRWSCPPEMGQLNYITPMEVFIARLKLALVLALAAAFPFNAWQLWRFLMPALYESERRALKWWIGASTLLFVMGAGFCLGTILPLLMRFSAGFATPNLKPVIGLAGFLELSGWLLLSFGLMFQFPLAAILTPPDVVSQLLLAVPTWILFEIGLLIAARQQKRREAAAAAELDDAVLDVYRQDNES